MTLVQNLRFHDYQFDFATAQGRWRWTTRLDVSLSAPSYSIRDVISPYGLLRDSVPIPGDVVIAMSDSIAELKAGFSPTILMGPPSSLTFTVDAGRGFSLAQTVQVTNSGTYGSLLDVHLSSSAAYVKVTPTEVGNLAKNESGSFQVSVDSTTLTSGMSPISASVTVQDASATNSPITYPVTITVRPKATISLSDTTLTFNVTKPISGPFPPIPTQTFDVTNAGPANSVLAYEIQKLTGLSDWLVSFLPSSGSLNSSASQTTTVLVQPPDSLGTGTYTETLRVSGYSTNSYQDIEIQLVVT